MLLLCKIPDRGAAQACAGKHQHPLFPFGIADQGNFFDPVSMLHKKRHVIPDFRPDPAAKIFIYQYQYPDVFMGTQNLKTGRLDSIQLFFPQGPGNSHYP